MLVLAAMCTAAPSFADETVTYSYDALERVVTSSYSGTGPNAGMANSITYDAAGNRTNYTITGSRFAAAIVVVPLNGFTVIPISAGTGQ